MEIKGIYKQEICTNCLQLLVNGESDHSEAELKQFNETIESWTKDNYIEAGLTDSESEGYFSWSKCDICDCLPGTRFEYNFFEK